MSVALHTCADAATRLSVFGFLGGKEVRDAGIGNLGLQDRESPARAIECTRGELIESWVYRHRASRRFRVVDVPQLCKGESLDSLCD